MLKRFIIGLLLLLIVLVPLVGCGSSKKETKQEEFLKGEIIAQELADKYQAITGWEENLNYTLQAQERLITEKPILFTGYVDDVFSRDGKTFVRFSPCVFCSIDYVSYVLELECNRQILETLLSQEQDNGAYLKFDVYAIVANIREVSKPVFALRGSALSEDEVEIDIESSDLFMIKGICLDIVNIGDMI